MKSWSKDTFHSQPKVVKVHYQEGQWRLFDCINKPLTRSNHSQLKIKSSLLSKNSLFQLLDSLLIAWCFKLILLFELLCFGLKFLLYWHIEKMGLCTEYMDNLKRLWMVTYQSLTFQFRFRIHLQSKNHWSKSIYLPNLKKKT